MKKTHYHLSASVGQDKLDLVSRIMEFPTPALEDGIWEIFITETEEDEFKLTGIIALLYEKRADLQKIGIDTSDFFLLMTLEYCGQCNMEFLPATLLRLGSMGVGLGVSCWENPTLCDEDEETLA